ncbi:MAG: hypothetical protein ACK50B_04715 [Betaproteobacteria bacterium]|jgi:uncharacterized membrane protein|nr:hypothetical protein [Burkholderiales bacterium]
MAMMTTVIVALVLAVFCGALTYIGVRGNEARAREYEQEAERIRRGHI